MNGIVLLAFGDVCYAKAAYNMAASIRYSGCRLPVMLIHDGNSKIDFSIFDHVEIIKVTEDAATTKMRCYERSIFDNTLYLDVDGMALKDITPLFNSLVESGVPYAHYIHEVYGQQDESYRKMSWASKETVRKYYGKAADNLPATQSSIQFFRKSVEAERLYKRVLELLADPIPAMDMRNLWGGGQPDELYLNIALAELGYFQLPEYSMFFGDKIAPLTISQIVERYYFLSIFGGRNTTRSIYLDLYDRLMIRLMRANGQEHRYKIPHINSGKHADKNRHLITQTQRQREVIRQHKERYSVMPDKLHLITTYFKAKSEERQNEINQCLEKNINNSEIDSITVLSECHVPIINPKLRVIHTDRRPTFNDCVMYCSSDINIIANSDIYFDNANSIKQLDFKNHYAITRHDYNNGRLLYRPFSGSQDVWIGKDIQPIEQDVEFGRPRCDQIIAYHLSLQKPVMNPARSIRCVHLHNSNDRTYMMKDELKGRGLHVEDKSTGAFKQRLLIHQPGQYGDILIVLPIAYHYYTQGYIVDLLCPERFHDIFRNIDYCTPVSVKENIYAKVIDLSFGINQYSDVHRWWMKNMHRFNSFVDAKYELSSVSYPQPLRWNHTYREQELYDRLNLKKPYTLVHEDYGIELPVDGYRIKPIQGYNIFDWYEVIINADEIHCIDSSIANFINYLNLDNCYIYEGRNGGGAQMARYDKWNKYEVSI